MSQPTDGLVDPGSAFLASGDPERFLSDNLPATDIPETDPNHRALAVGIAGAFLVWRLLAARELVSSAPPAILEAETYRKVRGLSVSWEGLVRPTLVAGYRGLGLSSALVAVLAEQSAVSLGNYLRESSTTALVDGYRAELAGSTIPQLAWERVATGFGLDQRAMRGWIIGQRQAKHEYADLAVGKGATQTLNRALMVRADQLGQTEGWVALETGRSTLWLEQQQMGMLSPDARKRWITAKDELVCPICGPLHEVAIALDEQFILASGKKIWSPGVHPNCRCRLVLVPDLELLVEKAWDERKHPRGQGGKFAYMRSEHQQVVHRTPEGKQVLLDEGLSRLVPELWKNGLSTQYSCQGGPSKVGRETDTYVWTHSREKWDKLAIGLDPKLLKQINVDPPESKRDHSACIRFDPKLIGPLTEALSGLVGKAYGSDTFDRDRKGRFSADEKRATRLKVLDRPRAEPATEPATEPTTEPTTKPAVANPFASATTANPFAAVANPFAEASTANPFAATANPFATVANPFATTATKPGNKMVIIIRNGKPEPLPDDRQVFAPVDWYHAAFDGSYGYAGAIQPRDHLPEDVTPADIGKEIDFDVWQVRRSEALGDKDLPGFLVRALPNSHGAKPLLDMIHEGFAEDTEEVFTEEDDIYYEVRSQIADQLWKDAPDAVKRMSSRQLQNVFLEAGMSQAVRDLGTQQLHDRLLEAVTESFASQENEYLCEAFTEHQLALDPEIQSQEASRSMASDLAFRVPQLFSFAQGTFAADRISNDPSSLLVHGKFRIVDVRTHSFTRSGLRRSFNPETGNKFNTPDHPQVYKWREVILEPV